MGAKSFVTVFLFLDYFNYVPYLPTNLLLSICNLLYIMSILALK